VAPEPEHVHIGFQHGILMDDPERRLLGSHLHLRKVRFLTLHSLDDVDAPAFTAFVREAARLARLTRGERFALALDRENRPDDRPDDR
jgi:hypothetical protein